jgi:8-oxo-dGTP diphosphatase
VHRVIARLWRLLKPFQWRILWFTHATFLVGVTGIVRDSEGRVLLLRHRLWAKGRQWGLPTGFARRSESFEETVVREVREETGLTVRVGRLARLTSGFRLRCEVAYEAEYVSGDLTLDPMEILEARWCLPTELPQGLQESHRLLIAST